MKSISILAALAASALVAAAPTAVTAATYDAVSDFSVAGNPNGVWAYGEGTAGSTFSGFVNTVTSGYGSVQFWQSSSPVDLVPLVGKNFGASAYTFATVLVPTGVLWVHPGQNDDVLVQFTAPTAGNYSYSGGFELLDNNPTGVIGEIFDNTTQIYTGALTGPGANLTTLTPGQSESFGGSIFLHAGDHLTFAVNNGGSFLNDSTGLTAIVSSSPGGVPEPATWALMLTGFAALGFSGYRRNKRGASPSVA